ncbi:hypothetical protein FQN57_006781 [Myotisia sp. PD_48]|nr:hypothetical protein FQN57_006781 [Myotisia sp. PD_48]
MNTPDIPSCPFCDFSDADGYFVVQHVELCHPENGASPFIASDDTAIAVALDASLNHQQSESGPWQDYHRTEDAFEYDNYEDEHPTVSYIDCPAGCGEAVTTAELPIHLDLHVAEGLALSETNTMLETALKSHHSKLVNEDIDSDDFIDDDEIPPEMRRALGINDKPVQPKHGRSPKKERDGPVNAKPKKKKLERSKSKGSRGQPGSTELGPHAREKQMPSWLQKMLEAGPKVTYENRIQSNGRLRRVEVVENETPGLIPVLASLCEQDDSVEQVFLCNPDVRHIFKMDKEGGFCGYRNIQMLISYIRDFNAKGHTRFSSGIPSILKLQDMIEDAWDKGFNAHARIETGGIRGTRKYIGTSEALALFRSLDIECQPVVCVKNEDHTAQEALFKAVAEYFLHGYPPPTDRKVVQTMLPPIYFQHLGHSLTIVGFELRKTGSVNILVFDPMFKTSQAAARLINNPRTTSQNPKKILKAFRRCNKYLGKYDGFEMLLTLPNIIITGTPGVGKTVHCEQLAQETKLKHLSINKIVKDRGCHDGYDDALKSYIVDEDKLLDEIEEEVKKGGYLIDWHACDLFPKSWIDLVVVIRCPSTSILYDRLSARQYSEEKLQENLDAEIFQVLLEEAREAYDEEIVVELISETDDAIETNCERIKGWIDAWEKSNANDSG